MIYFVFLYSGTDVRTTSYIPPFIYSYQCSSAFITTYAPIYILMFVIVTFVSPAVLTLAGMVIHNRTTRTNSKVSMMASMAKMLPNIMKPIEFTLNLKQKSGSSCESLLGIFISRRLFDCDVFVVQLINIVAVMVTFGVVFPPIAVISCAALYCVTYFTQSLIGRYVQQLRNFMEQHSTAVNLRVISADVLHVKQMFLNSMWMVVPFVVVFYSFLLFDILGDEVGWSRAIWMPVTLVCISLLGWLVWKCRAHLFRLWVGFGSEYQSSEHEFKLVGGEEESVAVTASEGGEENRSQMADTLLELHGDSNF